MISHARCIQHLKTLLIIYKFNRNFVINKIIFSKANNNYCLLIPNNNLMFKNYCLLLLWDYPSTLMIQHHSFKAIISVYIVLTPIKELKNELIRIENVMGNVEKDLLSNLKFYSELIPCR